jgi:hypothetical protein
MGTRERGCGGEDLYEEGKKEDEQQEKEMSEEGDPRLHSYLHAAQMNMLIRNIIAAHCCL